MKISHLLLLLSYTMAPLMCLPICSPDDGDDEGEEEAGGGEGKKKVKAEEEDESGSKLDGEIKEQGRLKAEDAAGSHDLIKEVFDAFDVNSDGVVTVQELCEWMQRLGLAITEDGIRDMVVKTSGHDKLIGFDEFRAFAQTLESEKAHHRLPRKSPTSCSTLADETPEEEEEEEEAEGKDSSSVHRDYHKGRSLPDDGDNNDVTEKSNLVDDATNVGVGVDDSDDDEIREAFRIFDKNGDGLISASDLRSTLSGLGLLSASTSFRRIKSMIRRVDTDLDGFVSLSEFKTMIKDNQ